MAVTHQLKSMPAPMGGLNARDGVANMQPTDAVELVNWIPDTGGVRCRKGYREWATNIPGGVSVKTIMSYFAPTDAFPTGTFLTQPTVMPGKLFAATDTAIYDITTKTSAPVASVTLSGTTNAGWISHAITSNSGGNFLMACSESDGYFTYDGTAWLRRVAGTLAGQVNGVNPNNLVHVNVWKKRAWFVERNTTKVWYLATDAIAGTATAFDFGPLFKKGGHLSFTASWTIDAGEGIDDFFVAVSSNGEVAIYKGSDPASASTFTLQGVWYIGQIPVGRRCYSAYGGDLLIVSTDGICPLSEVTRGGSGLLTASNKEYSSKISILVGEALRNTFTEYGWQLMVSPADRLMLCNVPNYLYHNNEQFALSTVVNQWTLLQDIPALCYGTTGGYTFTGTRDGRVLMIFKDYADNVTYAGTGGDPIQGKVVPAATDFGSAATSKLMTMVRPVFVGSVQPAVTVDVVMDYSPAPYGTTLSGVEFYTSLWNIALWNTGVWANGTKNSYADWYTVSGVGAAASAVLYTACAGDTVLGRVDYMFLPGGPL
jgi:hypothetical protein